MRGWLHLEGYIAVGFLKCSQSLAVMYCYSRGTYGICSIAVRSEMWRRHAAMGVLSLVFTAAGLVTREIGETR